MTLPRPIQLLLAGLGVLTLITVAIGGVLAFRQTPPAWFFLSFELVVAMGAVFLVPLGLGKIKEGPAITLLCCAGAIGVGAVLGWQATGRQIAGASIGWLVGLRALIAGLLLLAAAAELIVRDPKAVLPRLGLGFATGIPLVGMLALMQIGTIPGIMSKVNASSPPIAFGLWTLLGLAAAGLLSASGHYFITGFAAGVKAFDAKQPPAARPATQPASSSKPAGTQG